MNRHELCRTLRLYIKKAKREYEDYDSNKMLRLVDTFELKGADALNLEGQAALLLLIDYALPT